jgi:hypothetical protein
MARMTTICISVSLIMTAVMMHPSFASLLVEAVNVVVLLMLRNAGRAEGREQVTVRSARWRAGAQPEPSLPAAKGVKLRAR